MYHSLGTNALNVYSMLRSEPVAWSCTRYLMFTKHLLIYMSFTGMMLRALDLTRGPSTGAGTPSCHRSVALYPSAVSIRFQQLEKLRP